MRMLEADGSIGPESYRRLFYNRNTNFVAQIEGFLRQSKTTLVIAGAGHFVGTNGVVELLRNRNYDVLQLPGTPPSVGSLTLWYVPVAGENIALAVSADTTSVFVEQTSFTMTPIVNADGPLVAQWLKDGQQLPGATNIVFSKQFITSADSGAYQLSIQSEFGTATSGSVRLAVVPPTPPRLSIARSANVAELTLSGTTNAHYRLEFAERLSLMPWETLTNFTLLASPQTVADTITNESRFYRAVYAP